MGFLTYVSLVIFTAAALTAVVVIIHRSDRKRRFARALTEIDGFNGTQSFIAFDSCSSIAIDEGNRRLCLLKLTGNDMDCRVLNYADVLSSEVFEDGVTVTRTSRNSNIGSESIGGFGGASAAVGQASGRTFSTAKVKRMDLRLMIDDTKSPVHDINFWDKPIRNNSALYRQMSGKILHWHGLMAVALHQADKETTEPPRVEPPRAPPHFFVADELYKLVQLRDSGVLTPPEFEQQKRRLLS
jgi:hypothetical protein